MGSLTSHDPIGLQGLLQGYFYFMETVCASCEVRTGLLVLLQVASISQLTVSQLSRQCGIFNISQPYRHPRPVTEITLRYFTCPFIYNIPEK
jgi:hypothetical protein